MVFDIEVQGSNGFYFINGITPEGREWISNNVEGATEGQAFCDDAGRSQDIADAALEAGYAVGVNGNEYIGDGKAVPATV